MYKMIMLLGLLVAIMSVSASGAGIIGAPTAGLEKGQWNVGFNYAYIDTGLDETKMTDSMISTTKVRGLGLIMVPGYPDVTESSTGSGKMEIDNVKTQRYYGTIGYGLMDSWEVYVQLGIADLKAKTRDEGDSEWSGINFDDDFAWGWGTRYTFYEKDNIRWGASVQMNWINTSRDESTTYKKDIDYHYDGGTPKDKTDDTDLDFEKGVVVDETQIDWSTYDLLIAVGPTVDMGGWNLYGGPFYYMQKGDLDYTNTITAADLRPVGLIGLVVNGSATETNEGSGDLEADSIGGFVGAQYSLMEKYSMTAEVAFTGDGWAIGAGVCYAF